MPTLKLASTVLLISMILVLPFVTLSGIFCWYPDNWILKVLFIFNHVSLGIGVWMNHQIGIQSEENVKLLEELVRLQELHLQLLIQHIQYLNEFEQLNVEISDPLDEELLGDNGDPNEAYEINYEICSFLC